MNMYLVSFQIEYKTQWGESITVVGDKTQLGNWDPVEGLSLSHSKGGIWSGCVKLKEYITSFSYRYLLTNEQGEVVEAEWLESRLVCLPKHPAQIWLKDEWRAHGHPENAYYNTAFLKVIFRPISFKVSLATSNKVHFRLSAPIIPTNVRLCILGNVPELGAWDIKRPLLMENSTFPYWQAGIGSNNQEAIEYKYGFFSTENEEVISLEQGPNRKFSHSELSTLDLVVITDAAFRQPVSRWKGAGIAVPVFSILTHDSFGVGSFSDLLLLIRWVKEIGSKMVQILPVNDTMATKSWLDSSPYSAISVFALHPLYLDLAEIDGFDSIERSLYQKKQREFNALPKVDYEQVMEFKMLFARQIFSKLKHKLIEDQAFNNFREDNKIWLKSYVCFCALRDRFNSPDFKTWPEYDQYSETTYQELCANPTSQDAIRFYEFLQYQLDLQLRKVRSFARAQGVVLKGDIAIGVYPLSADTWANPQLFYLDRQAGAPPDPFSALGQNWGIPPYNWDEMAKDQYQWWQNRLAHFAKYFDAYRIDHILGFFRLWQIPIDQVQGVLGFFSPAIPVTQTEFLERKIIFDRERYCQPYITTESFTKIKREDLGLIKREFFTKKSRARFQFKAKYNSQKRIVSYFNKKHRLVDRKYEDFLLNLHTEVLFIAERVATVEVYHPRINLQKTRSFQSLDPEDQLKLRDLHDDYFYQRQEGHWRDLGMRKLPVIKSASDMLICGEDLGMIPKCVPEVMAKLDILTLEIERMPKRSDYQFTRPPDVPYLSVGSTSSHDMLPLRAWWQKLSEEMKRTYYEDQLGEKQDPPSAYSEELAKAIIEKHVAWPSMWMVFPIQDLLALSKRYSLEDAMDERINVPGDTKHYWRYRMPVAVEELIDDKGFNHLLFQMINKYR